MSIFIPK